jgi:hypothetical protein
MSRADPDHILHLRHVAFKGFYEPQNIEQGITNFEGKLHDVNILHSEWNY